MFYQLPNGRVIEITTEQFLDMTDEELEYLIVYNYGDIVENPWHGSILGKHDKDLEENPEILTDVTDVTEIDKLLDLDVDSKFQEE